jgi:hypothetical protein
MQKPPHGGPRFTRARHAAVGIHYRSLPVSYALRIIQTKFA